MKRIDPKQQFSKWLAIYGAIAWGAFLILVIALLFVRPETSMACVYMLLIVTANKALDTVAYTRNSITEKILYNIIDKTTLELNFKGLLKNVVGSKEDEEEEDEEEGESNG